MTTMHQSTGCPAPSPSAPRRAPIRWLGIALVLGVFALHADRADAQTPFVGQIEMFAGTFAPAGWLFCEGQLVPIAEHEALFNLIGTTYGGDGFVTFALPDLRGRVIISAGPGSGLSNYVVGQMGGAEIVTLTQNQLPAHSHAVFADSLSGSSDKPSGLLPADAPDGVPSFSSEPVIALPGTAIAPAGGGQAHNNVKPYLAIRYIIAVEGIFPSRP